MALLWGVNTGVRQELRSALRTGSAQKHSCCELQKPVPCRLFGSTLSPGSPSTGCAPLWPSFHPFADHSARNENALETALSCTCLKLLLPNTSYRFFFFPYHIPNAWKPVLCNSQGPPANELVGLLDGGWQPTGTLRLRKFWQKLLTAGGCYCIKVPFISSQTDLTLSVLSLNNRITDGYSQNCCIFSELHKKTKDCSRHLRSLPAQCSERLLPRTESKGGSCVAKQVISMQEMVDCSLEGQL